MSAEKSFYRTMNKQVLQKVISIWSSDEPGDKPSNPIIDTTHLKIIGYKIKEDMFIDNTRMVSESRIISLCPVGVNSQTKDTTDLYWIYFPPVSYTHLDVYKRQTKSRP